MDVVSVWYTGGLLYRKRLLGDFTMGGLLQAEIMTFMTMINSRFGILGYWVYLTHKNECEMGVMALSRVSPME